MQSIRSRPLVVFFVLAFAITWAVWVPRAVQQFELEVVTILQISGLEYAYDESNPEGGRVTETTLPDGGPLDPSATYTVAANSFLLTGGDGFTVFKAAKNAETPGGDLEALVQYVENLPQPFTAPDPGEERRITSNR